MKRPLFLIFLALALPAFAQDPATDLLRAAVELSDIPIIAFRLAVVAYEPEVQTISHPASVPETLDELLARARASGEDRVFECPLQGRPAALTHDGQRTSVQIWLDGKDHVTTSEPGPAVEVSFTPKIAENGAIDADVSMRWFSERRGSDSLASSSVCHQVFMPGRVKELGGSLLPRSGKDKKFFRAFLELNIQKDPATNALPAGLPGLYHSRGRPYSSGLVEIDESGRMSAEARDAKWHPVPATRRKLSPVGTIRPAPEAGPGLLAFTSDETGPDGKRGVGHLAFDADRLTIHWLAYDKEHARPWMVEFAETGFFYDPREDLIRLDTDLATLWCDTMYRFEPSDGGVTELVYSLWDEVGNLTPQQRRDLDEILARKIRALSNCRAMMHGGDAGRPGRLDGPLVNPCDGKPDPILDVSPDLRPAITRLPPAPDPAANASDPSRLPDEFVLVPAAVDSYTAVPPPPGLVPNWLYAVGIDHRKCFELVCTDREKKHFCTLGTRASIYSSFKLEWLDADTLLYTSGDIGTWAVFPTEEGRWNIRAATVRRNDSGAVESFELDYWLYPTNFTPQWPAIPALPATPGPAEKTHAESAEGAELLPEQIGVGSRPHEGE